MREVVTPKEIVKHLEIRRDKGPGEKVTNMYGNLALPSYVHGYSLAIQYITKWFESKFPKNYFKGGIYIDGKHVLDDYKKFSSTDIVKGQNPRARIAPTIEYDFDRDMIDTYLASPELYLKRSPYNESFFKDYNYNIFLGMCMRALRMNFNIKVRVSTRSQQLDLFNKMELAFRIGATQHEMINVDFHIPKSIILNIADRAGFRIINGEVVNIIEFLEYMNSHSDLPFLFKMRAINQQPEFFIRVNNVYTHIAVRDKLQLDDGERDGKLDYNFHIEMNIVLTIPIPHFYAYYSATELTSAIELKEHDDAIAIYSICAFEIPKVDENGWGQAAIIEYMTDIGDTEIDLSSQFTGDNVLAQAIQHDLTRGMSPSHFINVKIFKTQNVAKLCNIEMDWKTFKVKFDKPEDEENMLSIVVYYDRAYINNLDIELNRYNESRITAN